MSPLKEPHFFSGIRPRREWASHFPTVTTEAEYEHLFKAAGQATYLGDASTSYLWAGSRAAEAIWRHNPRARIIAVLRDPVDRAYSHYWNDTREGIESRSFEDALTDELDRTYTGQWGQDSLYIDAGRYRHQVEGFLEYFGEQMLILAYEDLSTAPATVAHRLSTFLDLASATTLAIPQENVSQSPRGRVGRYAFRSSALRSASRHVLPRSGRRLTRSSITPWRQSTSNGSGGAPYARGNTLGRLGVRICEISWSGRLRRRWAPVESRILGGVASPVQPDHRGCDVASSEV